MLQKKQHLEIELEAGHPAALRGQCQAQAVPGGGGQDHPGQNKEIERLKAEFQEEAKRAGNMKMELAKVRAIITTRKSSA